MNEVVERPKPRVGAYELARVEVSRDEDRCEQALSVSVSDRASREEGRLMLLDE